LTTKKLKLIFIFLKIFLFNIYLIFI